MAHLADLGRRHVAEDIPVEMHHAALRSRLWQVLSRALHQAAAGIRNDQLHAREAAIDQVSQKRRPTGFVLLGALADAENLAKSFRVDRAGHQERDIANLASPAALHPQLSEACRHVFANKILTTGAVQPGGSIQSCETKPRPWRWARRQASVIRGKRGFVFVGLCGRFVRNFPTSCKSVSPSQDGEPNASNTGSLWRNLGRRKHGNSTS
jgi:hypothetical protein